MPQRRHGLQICSPGVWFMFLIPCFIENKNYDTKMSIPTERESYHNLKIC